MALGFKEFAMYAWMALRRRKLGDAAGVTWNNDGRDANCREYLEVIARMCNWEIDMSSREDTYRNAWAALADGYTKDDWALTITHIRTALSKTLDYAADAYYVGTLGTVGNGRSPRRLRGLTIQPECIVCAEALPPASFELPMGIPPSR